MWVIIPEIGLAVSLPLVFNGVFGAFLG